MISDVTKSLAPLATAIASAGLAWCFLQDAPLSLGVFVVSIVLTALCSSAFALGEQTLPADPQRGLRLMGIQRFAYWMAGAVGAAIVIRVGLLFPSDLEGENKELVGALGSGATAFVTAMFASVSDEKAQETLADRIKDAFQSRYLREGKTPSPPDLEVHYFVRGSRGERLVHATRFEDIDGWSPKARRKRAKRLADELEAGTSNASIAP